jgi:hypothetical protein
MNHPDLVTGPTVGHAYLTSDGPEPAGSEPPADEPLPSRFAP